MSGTVDAEVPVKSVRTQDTASHELDKKHLVKRVVTLGSVRHRHEHTGEVILIPTPSADPNDPLNW